MSFGPPRTSMREARLLSGSVLADPASVPLPKVDLAEVEALNRPCGSEDQIIPDSDGESDMEGSASVEEIKRRELSSVQRLNLSQYLYG